MEQNTFSSAFGTASFKVKYRTVELQTAPAVTATSLGTLKRGAVVSVIEDVSRYYYRVRLDNGLEGYVYKPAGEISNNLAPTSLPPVASKPSSNGALPAADLDGAVAPNKLNGVEPPLRNGNTYGRNGNGSGNLDLTTTVYSNIGQKKGAGTGAYQVVITSGEIAALDKPGIVGRQVSKLKRNDIVSVISEDSFFYQVALPNGAVGYIPRYSAESHR